MCAVKLTTPGTRAHQIDRLLRKLRSDVETGYLEMGKLLVEFRDHEYYLDLGFPSLKGYAEHVLGFKVRKVQYLISTYQAFEKLTLSAEEKRRIGPSKARELAAVIDAKNAREWVEKALNLSFVELQHEVRGSLRRREGADELIYRRIGAYESDWEEIDRALEIASRLTGSDKQNFLLVCLAREFIATYGLEPEPL